MQNLGKLPDSGIVQLALGSGRNLKKSVISAEKLGSVSGRGKGKSGLAD